MIAGAAGQLGRGRASARSRPGITSEPVGRSMVPVRSGRRGRAGLASPGLSPARGADAEPRSGALMEECPKFSAGTPRKRHARRPRTRTTRPASDRVGGPLRPHLHPRPAYPHQRVRALTRLRIHRTRAMAGIRAHSRRLDAGYRRHRRRHTRRTPRLERVP
jgi:hypothetical protein